MALCRLRSDPGGISPAARCSESEVRRHWEALTPKQRRDVLSYSDQALVDGVRASVRGVAKESTAVGLFMRCLQGPGASLADIPNCDTALRKMTDASRILSGFAFGILRTDITIPAYAKDKFCKMAAQLEFVEDPRFFDRVKDVLPSFLANRVNRQGRFPLSRTRWKDLWAERQTSVGAIDLQLCKLIEQSLWDMVLNPTFEVADPYAIQDEDGVKAIESPTASPSNRKKKKKPKAKAGQSMFPEMAPEVENDATGMVAVEISSEIDSKMDRHVAVAHPSSEELVSARLPDLAVKRTTIVADDVAAGLEKLAASPKRERGAFRKKQAKAAKAKALTQQRQDGRQEEEEEEEEEEHVEHISHLATPLVKGRTLPVGNGTPLTDSRSNLDGSTELQSDAESQETTISSVSSTPRASQLKTCVNDPLDVNIDLRGLAVLVTEKNTFLHFQEQCEDSEDECEMRPWLRMQSCPPSF